jgi:putative NIF3 family GTP cyclohydrolase 1 type 2
MGMKNHGLTRRKFINLTGAGIVAGVGVGVLPKFSFATSPAKITAGEVMDRIKKQVAVPWRATTVDTIKGGGSPDMVVTGITTTFMATLDVMEKSIKAGNNFILAHEPTFWTNLDLGEGLDGDPLYLHKLDFIKQNKLFVHRFHDHWHARRPDGIFEGWDMAMRWDKYKKDETTHVVELPQTITLRQYAQEVKRRLKSDGIRVVGDPDLKVRTVSRGSNKVPGRAPAADVTIQYEPDRENNNVEWERDLIASGQKKGFIIISHNRLEELGMDNCATWLKTFVPEVPIQFIQSGDPFWRTT